jgi:hypothetical protein
MTRLSLAVRNTLAQYTPLTALLGRSASWDTWIFDEKPVMIRFEKNSAAVVVINEGEPYTSPNPHNRMYFPSLVVDVWADPDRGTDGNITRDNAKDKILDIQRAMDRILHTVDTGGPGGGPIIWGTAEEIAQKTGVIITGSMRLSGPVFSPISGTETAWMGRFTYGVNQL